MASNFFGEYIRELRAQRRLGLREFCLESGYDPSQWSKIERGIISPPEDQEVLGRIANILDVEVGSREWTKMKDLAALGRGKVPADILSNQKLLASLPLVFRTIRGDKPTEDELRNLADLIRHS